MDEQHDCAVFRDRRDRQYWRALCSCGWDMDLWRDETTALTMRRMHLLDAKRSGSEREGATDGG